MEQINIEVKQEMKTSGATDEWAVHAEQAGVATCLNWYEDQTSDALAPTCKAVDLWVHMGKLGVRSADFPPGGSSEGGC